MDKTQILGKGSTGEVYLGKQLSSNQPVAIKLIRLQTIDNQVTEYLLRMEKLALTTLNHDNVLKGHKIIENASKCYMVTQYCNGGTLKQLIRKQGALSQQKSIEVIKAVLKGYNALVRKKIVHRDLKPANIMFHNNVPKIIDFGYCEIDGHQKPSLQYNVGSPSYMAPESFQSNIYNQKTQIWAIGIILYECLMGKTFDDGKHMSQIFKALKKYGIPYGKQITEKCRKVISWCLEFNPERRPTALDLINHLTEKKANEPEFFILDKNRKKSNTFYANTLESSNLLTKRKVTAAVLVDKKLSSALQTVSEKKPEQIQVQAQTLKRKISIKQYPRSPLQQLTQRPKSRSNSKSNEKYGFITKNPVLRKTQNTQQFQSIRQRVNSNYQVKNEYGLLNSQNSHNVKQPIFKTQKYFTGQNVQNKLLSAQHPVSAFNSGLTSPRQMSKNPSVANQLNRMTQRNPQSIKTRVSSKQTIMSPLNDNLYHDEKYPSYSTYRPSMSQHEDNYIFKSNVGNQNQKILKATVRKQNQNNQYPTGQKQYPSHHQQQTHNTLTTRHMSHYYPSSQISSNYQTNKQANLINHPASNMLTSNRQRPASSIYQINRYLEEKQKPISIFGSLKVGEVGQRTCR